MSILGNALVECKGLYGAKNSLGQKGTVVDSVDFFKERQKNVLENKQRSKEQRNK